jgi:hypothetical protein
MKTITTFDEFMDSVMNDSDAKATWNVKTFMDGLNRKIIKALKNNQEVEVDVYIAWHQLYALLGTEASRERIRSTALGIKDWLKSTV